MKQNTKKAYAVLIGSVFFIIILVLGFTTTLNILSFRQNYEDSLVKSYALAGEQTVEKIEYAVKYGKPLSNFYGMQDILSEVKKYLPDLENIFVIMPDGKIAYDMQGRVNDSELEYNLQQELNAALHEDAQRYVSISYAEQKNIFLPIYTPDGVMAGALDIIFDEQIIAARINVYMHSLILYLSILSFVAVVLIIVLYKFFTRSDKTAGFNKTVSIRVILGVLAVAQIVFGIINYSMFKSGYLTITRETASLATSIVSYNVDSVINKGVPYEKLYNLDKYLKTIVDTIPQIDNITITNTEGEAVYSAVGEGTALASAVDDEFTLLVPLQNDVRGISGNVNVVLSGSIINSAIRDIMFDAITIIIVSFFFMIEVTLLALDLVGSRIGVKGRKKTEKKTKSGLVRPLAFIVYGAVFMTAAFVPVIMSIIYEPVLGLPKDIGLGLPISVEMLFGFLATVAAGYAIDSKGWKGSFVGGIILFVLGSLLSGYAASPLPFIAARGLAGGGFGLLVMAMRAMIISSESEAGIADMNAGATAGVTCGVVTGAMVADRLGYATVFYISAVLVIPALILAVKEIANSGAVDKAKKQIKGSLSRFLLDRHAVSFLILILIPFSICAMFLNYYFPLYANTAGMSSSNVGRAFMLNALCIVYLGPALSKYFAGRLGFRKTLILSVLVTVFSITAFAVMGSLPAAFAALILLGVSDSFGISAQIGVFMSSKGAAVLGEGKAIAYYSLIGKLGQMLGPITFGAVAFLGAKGTGLIGLLVFAALILYAVITREKTLEKSTPRNNSRGMQV